VLATGDRMMNNVVREPRTLVRALGVGGIGAALLLRQNAAGAADKEDGMIKLADVPANVKKGADKAVPKAKWKEAFKHEEKGKIIYELDGTIGKDNHVTVELTADG